jgi:cellulose synthase/poly-beta-1,6-N-acetylglucosamine synthase-like glycosyltransferase
MFTIGAALLFISLVGFGGMTFLPAILSLLMYQFKKNIIRYPALPLIENKVSIIEVLIPVHNQPEALHATLKNLEKLILLENILVGVNACTDETLKVVSDFAVRSIKRSPPGKWGMLKDLILTAKGDWLVIMDCGTLLPEDFFQKIDLQNSDSKILGFAPRYFPKKLTALQKAIWIFEGLLKKLENLSGGPVSVHGACVIYRRDALLKVMSSLNVQEAWLNDDVVIPLWLRFQNPYAKLVYRFDVCVDDFDIHTEIPSPQRRERLMKGNLEWISALWPQIIKSDLCLFTLSSRRIFRLLWAWWPTFFLAGFLIQLASFSFTYALFLFVVTVLLMTFALTRKSELPSAFNSSLKVFQNKNAKTKWK